MHFQASTKLLSLLPDRARGWAVEQFTQPCSSLMIKSFFYMRQQAKQRQWVTGKLLDCVVFKANLLWFIFLAFSGHSLNIQWSMLQESKISQQIRKQLNTLHSSHYTIVTSDYTILHYSTFIILLCQVISFSQWGQSWHFVLLNVEICFIIYNALSQPLQSYFHLLKLDAIIEE